MKSFAKKLLAMLCMVLLCVYFMPAGRVMAADRTIKEVQQEIEEKKEYINELAQKIEDNKNNRQAAEAALAEYQKAYNDLILLIDEQEVLIDTANEQLEDKTQQLSDTIVSIGDNREMYTQRLQAVYQMNSSNALLGTLLAVDSYSELMQVADGIKRISQRDTELLSQLADQKAAYQAQKEELENTIVTLNEEMDRLQENRDWNEAKMQEMKGVIANASYQIQLDEAETEETEEEIEKLIAELAAIFKALQSKGSQAGDGSVRYDGPLLWPVPGNYRISSYFGDPRSNTRSHYGIDIPGATGTPIVAAASGTVLTNTWHYSYGNYVVLDHGQGLRTLYAHCAAPGYVAVGEYVSVGDTIAGVGNTGNSYGAHLHFEVHEHGGRQNPLGSGYLSV